MLPRMAGQPLSPHGISRIEIAEKIIDSPRLTEYRGFERQSGGAKVRHVGVSVFTGFQTPIATAEALETFRIHPQLQIPVFPAIESVELEADQRITCSWEWLEACSLKDLTADAGEEVDEARYGFAFHVLERLTEALESLATVRVNGRSAVHGAIAPEGIWVAPDATVQLHNHLYGIAMDLDDRRDTDEQDDLRGLIQVFCRIGLHRWPMRRVILEPDLAPEVPRYVSEFLQSWAQSETAGVSSLANFRELLSCTVGKSGVNTSADAAREWLDKRAAGFRLEREKLARSAKLKAAESASKTDMSDSVHHAINDILNVAEQAWSERRLKDCLMVVRTIDKLDPNNTRAQTLRKGVQSELEKMLAGALAMHESGRERKDSDLCARADRTLKILLNIDPDFKPGQDLLARNDSVIKALASSDQGNALPKDSPKQPAPSRRSNRWLVAVGAAVAVAIAGLALWLPSIREARAGRVELVVDSGVTALINGGTYTNGAQVRLNPGKYTITYQLGEKTIASEEIEVTAGNPVANRITRQFARVELVAAPADGLLVVVDNDPALRDPRSLTLTPGKHQLLFLAENYEPQRIDADFTPGESRKLVIALQPTSSPENTTAPPTAGPAPTSTAATMPALPAPADQPGDQARTGGSAASITAQTPPPVPAGKIAFEAAVPLEVLRNGQVLGRTPLTIDAAAGAREFQYRVQDTIRTIRVNVAANRTTRTVLSAEITLDINVRPWADVFIDGPQPQPLGQTPLAQVRVAAGSTLIFRNPRFTEMRYRVQVNDRSVQLAFP